MKRLPSGTSNYYMKKLFVLSAILIGAATASQAAGRLHIGLPLPPLPPLPRIVIGRPAPVYPPAVVYQAPAPVCPPAVVYGAPDPVYVPAPSFSFGIELGDGYSSYGCRDYPRYGYRSYPRYYSQGPYRHGYSHYSRGDYGHRR